MNKKFLYCYLAIFLVAFSLLLGLVADAFTVLSGGGISVPNAINDPRAVVNNGYINSVIHQATTTLFTKYSKRIAGGCEKWEITDPRYNDYFRIRVWGQATTSLNGVSHTANCRCIDNNFAKILVRTTATSVQNIHGNCDGWYSRYKLPPNLSPYESWPPVCVTLNDDQEHRVLGKPYDARAHCYKYPILDCDGPWLEHDRYYLSYQQAQSYLQQSSKFSYILRNYLFPTALAESTVSPLGCGLISLKCVNNMPLYEPVNVAITTWVCVNTSTTSTVTGWDN